jgi:aminoglycoside phosphotransferase (APT) family kinase protein
VERPLIDATLARRLVAEQFPRWAELPLRPVPRDGWDNRTFRLGEELTLRLPSAERYAAQVETEQRWLPRLGPHLPLPIPSPVALGRPGCGYPWHWSVMRWLDGEDAARAPVDHAGRFARSLAAFLSDLQRLDASGGPKPGRPNFHRGGPLRVYDAEARKAIAALGERVDGRAATAAWEEALATTWTGPPVWVHGDVSAGNLLVRDGRLHAVIDFGGLAVGDPACDLAIAWTLFSGASREAFRASLPLDEATWARARGWALWKALITLVEPEGPGTARGAWARRALDACLS